MPKKSKSVSPTKSTEITSQALQITIEEKNKIEKRLLEIADELRTLDQSLHNKYKVIATSLNQNENPDMFLKPTDYTKNTLYYCFHPMVSSSAIFFIPTKDNTGLIPIQCILQQVETPTGVEDNFHVIYNNNFAADALKQKSVSIMDILIPYKNLDSCLVDEPLNKLIAYFENPPDATDSTIFKNIIFERLFAITADDVYKLPAIPIP